MVSVESGIGNGVKRDGNGQVHAKNVGGFMDNLVFLEIELAHKIVNDVYSNFKEGKEVVERSRPSRWNNPVLVAVSKEAWSDFRYTGECEADQLGELRDLVIAVPESEKGYGNQYRGVVAVNRERLGLK